MNVILNGQQSDTKIGALNLPASVNLTGLECSLVKLFNNAGVLNFALPTGVTDEAYFVLGSGGTAGSNVVAEPPALNDNCRVLIDSTNAINPGDLVSLSPNVFGRLYKPITGAGAGFYTFQAEEAVAAGAVGQLAKVRRIPDRAFNL
jgi:hypothetical protein